MNEVTSLEYSPLNEMRLISQGKMHEPVIAELNGKHIENQAKLFLAAQARNELQRIIKLTEFLDKLEAKFINVVNKQMLEQPDNINLLVTSMNIITQSLERSNELVNNVLKDNSLQTLVLSNVNLIPGSEQTSMLSRKSRDAIRSVATRLITELQSDSIIDVEVNNSDEDTIVETNNNTTNSDSNLTEAQIIDNKISELMGD